VSVGGVSVRKGRKSIKFFSHRFSGETIKTSRRFTKAFHILIPGP